MNTLRSDKQTADFLVLVPVLLLVVDRGKRTEDATRRSRCIRRFHGLDKSLREHALKKACHDFACASTRANGCASTKTKTRPHAWSLCMAASICTGRETVWRCFFWWCCGHPLAPSPRMTMRTVCGLRASRSFCKSCRNQPVWSLLLLSRLGAFFRTKKCRIRRLRSGISKPRRLAKGARRRRQVKDFTTVQWIHRSCLQRVLLYVLHVKI